ncbi:MAG: hypothetical protein ACHQ6U_05770 [Thermodesulfobacteriota bacterium]
MRLARGFNQEYNKLNHFSIIALMQSKCAEIKIRSERRAGEILKDLQEKGDVLKKDENLEIRNPQVNDTQLHDEIALPKTLVE